VEKRGSRPFSHRELNVATEFFSTRLGAGAYGEVFRGRLPEHRGGGGREA